VGGGGGLWMRDGKGRGGLTRGRRAEEWLGMYRM